VFLRCFEGVHKPFLSKLQANTQKERVMQAYLSPDDCNLAEFTQQVSRSLTQQEVPQAHDVQNNIPIYDVTQLDLTGDTRALKAEWAHVFLNSAGVLLLKNAYQDTRCIDAASAIYERIIADEKAAQGEKADHFAASGANDRIWNSAQKLCQQDPKIFAQYFGNLAIDAACEAWLGPNYQMTAQVNLVRPSGAAQSPHRDYHLGFQPREVAARYPAHVHDLSPVLTLQGAIAHVDMPIESGPTKLLPFSQRYRHGYLAFTMPEFRAFFEDNFVQVPLKKGDVLFFNPALYHAGGANVSPDVQRMANLLQISSAYGRALENLDRQSMTHQLYEVLSRRDHGLSAPQVDAAISACAEGYSFPTNLDTDPPIGGLAPEAPAALCRRALAQEMPVQEFNAALSALYARKMA
jgi:ectoine hydroxylase-related dioxygenase (phytanoyl-CoA dioxygenase family)